LIEDDSIIWAVVALRACTRMAGNIALRAPAASDSPTKCLAISRDIADG
jgi:hypothetical protein